MNTSDALIVPYPGKTGGIAPTVPEQVRKPVKDRHIGRQEERR
jgi:hypothetical protein